LFSTSFRIQNNKTFILFEEYDLSLLKLKQTFWMYVLKLTVAKLKLRDRH